MRTSLKVAVLFVIAGIFSGCGTVDEVTRKDIKETRVFGGVRRDWQTLTGPPTHLSFLIAWTYPFVAVDIPLSIGADCVVLPYCLYWESRQFLVEYFREPPLDYNIQSEERLLELVTALREGENEERRVAIDVLSRGRYLGAANKMVPILIDLLGVDDPELARYAVAPLAYYGRQYPPALRALKVVQNDTERRWELRQRIVDVFSRPPYSKASADTTPINGKKDRSAELSRLTRGSREEVISNLKEALSDEDEDFRRNVVVQLGDMNPKAVSAIPKLVALFNDEREPVRNAASQSLVKIGAPAIPEILKAMRHKSWIARGHAAETLYLMGTKSDRVIQALQKMLKDEDPVPRHYAIKALAKIEKERKTRVFGE